MISIYLNTEKILLDEVQSLDTILIKHGYVDQYFAVAINQHFIPRTQYANTFLKEGDKIEMVFPMQGG